MNPFEPNFGSDWAPGTVQIQVELGHVGWVHLAALYFILLIQVSNHRYIVYNL